MYLFTVRWFGGYDQIRSDIRSLLMLTYCYAALIVIAEPSALTNVTHYHMYCIYISNCLDRSNIFLTCRRKINYNRYLFFFPLPYCLICPRRTASACWTCMCSTSTSSFCSSPLYTEYLEMRRVHQSSKQWSHAPS